MPLSISDLSNPRTGDFNVNSDSNIHEKKMTPRKPKSQHHSEMFRISLLYACRPDHQLVKLAKQIPWEMFEKRFEELNCPDNVRPGLPVRIMVGQLLLKHACGLSDEEEWWLDSYYAHYFCRETHFQQELAKRVMAQVKTSKNKMCGAQALKVECNNKGKVHKRYELRVKVGVAMTNRSNFVLDVLTFSGNPYDGHTLSAQFGQNRVWNSRLKRLLKRRQATQQIIGHIKHDGLLERNYLKDTEGNKMNAMLSFAGRRLPTILNMIRKFYNNFWRRLFFDLGLDKSKWFLAFQRGHLHADN